MSKIQWKGKGKQNTVCSLCFWSKAKYNFAFFAHFQRKGKQNTVFSLCFQSKTKYIVFVFDN